MDNRFLSFRKNEKSKSVFMRRSSFLPETNLIYSVERIRVRTKNVILLFYFFVGT